jgi:hypothetical protein
MEAIRSSETSVNPRSTPRHIPEDNILHSHRCENLKSTFFIFIYDLLNDIVAQTTLQRQMARCLVNNEPFTDALHNHCQEMAT